MALLTVSEESALAVAENSVLTIGVFHAQNCTVSSALKLGHDVNESLFVKEQCRKIASSKIFILKRFIN